MQHCGALHAGVIARSAMHFLIAGKAWTAVVSSTGAQQPAGGEAASPPWVLDRHMICNACALPASGPPIGDDVEMFLEQAVIAVGVYTAFCGVDTLFWTLLA